MKQIFTGNFGTIELIIDDEGNAMGKYQKAATLEGTYIDNTFNGKWANKGLSGLVTFTVNDGKLAGNWKKGEEPGPMKSKWNGKLMEATPSSKLENVSKKEPKSKKAIVDPAILQLKEDIDKLFQEGTGDDLKDSQFDEAMELVIEEQYCTVSLLQKKLYLGKYRSQVIIDQLKLAGLIGPLVNEKYTILEGPYTIPADQINGYLVVIDKFENNKAALESDEDVVYHYLWSLHLTEGNEDKCYEMIQHYEVKFKTDRWLKLKGHCYVNKKWYDYALTAYENSSEIHYAVIQKIFADFSNLIEEEKWDDAISYFKENLYLSISDNHLDVGYNYCRALFRGSESNEVKALEQLKKYLEKYSDNKSFLNLAASIASYIGRTEYDFDMLDEAATFYKKSGNNDGVARIKESIKKTKQEAREVAANEKQAAKEAAAEEKKATREAAAKAKMLKHKFKSSRGVMFCKYCGNDNKNFFDGDCYNRINGHNFVYMKVEEPSWMSNPTTNWEITCNKCGTNAKYSDSNCS